jgi:glycosyltransferase involved in cell wall biosynthesis
VTPYISIVIATYNRHNLLARTLAALAMQSWPRDRFEIIVADNGSTDDTRSVIETASKRPGWPRLWYLFIEEKGKSHAVNAALKQAAGDIVVFTDDDVQPDPGWLAAISAAFEDTGVDFVAGRVKPLWEVPPPAWVSRAVYGVLAIPDNGDDRIAIVSGHRHDVIPIGANMAVRRHVIDRLGGLRVDLGKLDGTLRTGEDHEFFLRMMRAGYRGVYEPDAIVHHWVPTERLQRSYFRKWLYQNGQDVARLEASYSSPVRRLLRVPRYLWRQAVGDAWKVFAATLRRDPGERFAAATRILWVSGYAREAWR